MRIYSSFIWFYHIGFPFYHIGFPFYHIGFPVSIYAKFFKKTNISNPMIRTRTWVRNVSFSENFAYVLNGWPHIGFPETTLVPSLRNKGKFDCVLNMPLIYQWIIKIKVLAWLIHYVKKTIFYPEVFVKICCLNL